MRITRRHTLGLLAASASAAHRETGWTPPRTVDLEAVWPWIKPHRRTAIRLHPEPGAHPLPPAASKIGGAFLWPSNEAWPHCRERDPHYETPKQSWDEFVERQREFRLMEGLMKGVALPSPANPAALERAGRELERVLAREKAKGLPQLTKAELAEVRKQFDDMNTVTAQLKLTHSTAYLPVIQLRRDEFPELPWPAGKDIFQLLWCPRVHWEGNGMHDPDEPPRQSPGFVLKWRTERLVGPVLAKPPKPREHPGLTECVLHPEAINEFPQASEFVPGQIQPHLDRLAPLLLHHGAKETDAQWRYSYDIAVAPGSKLLGYPQWIQSDETPECANCGARMRLLVTCASQEDAQSAIWSPAARRAQSARYQNPSGQNWGDWSNAYIFFCAVCQPLRIRSVVQTS